MESGNLMAMVLIVSGAVAFAVLMLAKHREAMALELRVDRTIGLQSYRPGHSADGWRTPPWIRQFWDMLRLVFTIGVKRLWGVRLSTAWLALIGIASAIVTWLLFHTVLHLAAWIGIVAALSAFLVLPRMVMARQQRRAEVHFATVFPDAVDTLVRALRAGLPVSVGIRAVAEDSPRPVSTVFAKIVDETEIGITLEDSLAGIVKSIDLPDFNFFVTAVSLQRATGGNLAQTLETLSEIIRKRRAMQLKAFAATSEVRLSAIILGAIPFLVFLALALVSPTYIDELIHDPRGNVIVGIALLLLLLAGLSMRWMVRRNTAI